MKEPQKSMFLFVWILCLTVLFDEEVMVGGSGGRSWSLVYVCAQGDHIGGRRRV